MSTVDETKWQMMSHVLPKMLFKGVTILTKTAGESGFAINKCTVKFYRRIPRMSVLRFDNSGKVNARRFPFPESREQLVECLIDHCGKDEIIGQLKTKKLVTQFIKPTT